MAVSIIPKFTRKQIEDIILDRKQRIDQAVVMLLRRAGENFVKNAREGGNYRDQTGNLRSSIGYVVLKNGERLYQDFRSAFRGKRGASGTNEASKVVEEIAREFSSGYVLIGVAGMDYAAAVESKGYDVITASATTAETELKNAIARLELKIPRMR